MPLVDNSNNVNFFYLRYSIGVPIGSNTGAGRSAGAEEPPVQHPFPHDEIIDPIIVVAVTVRMSVSFFIVSLCYCYIKNWKEKNRKDFTYFLILLERLNRSRCW